MASTDSRPVPIKNVAFRVVFPIYDADGDVVTGATGLDSEVSKDQGTFTDCTNEATEIATNSGIYYLDLTSTEMNADSVAVIVKTSSSGAKTTVLTFYPNEAGDIDVDVTSVNGSATAAAFMALLMDAGLAVTVDNTGFTATATIFETSTTAEATASHRVGKRADVIASGTLTRQALGIVTASSLVSGRERLTVSPGSPTAEAIPNASVILLY